MNQKVNELVTKITEATDHIWCDYYAKEGINSGDIDLQSTIQYERLIDKIAEIIYEVGESNREVHMIKNLDAFEKSMQEKYPYLAEIRNEEVIYFDDGKKERYTAWLKFPYYSDDSRGGFFTFYDEEEFEKWITSVHIFTEEEIKNNKFEIEQYAEFYNSKHEAVFNLNKALNLLHNAIVGNMKVVGYGINIANKNSSFERVATFNDENIAKVFYNSLLMSDEIKSGAKIDLEKICEVKDGYEYEVMLKNYKRVFKVTIEEHVSETFDVEADTIEEAMEIAEQKYNDGEFVLESGNLTYKCMSADDGNGDCTEWVEF